MWGWVALAVAAAALLLAIGAYGRALRLLPDPDPKNGEWYRRTSAGGFWIRVKMTSVVRDQGAVFQDEVIKEHQCVKPLLGVDDMDSFGAGSVWRCGCGKTYSITRWVTPAGSLDFIPEWIEA